MRISTNQIHLHGVNSILDQQSQLSKTQMQLATGRRILTPADDPSGAAQVLTLQQAVSQTDQYQKNADIAHNRLSLEENALVAAGDVLQRVRELTVQAANTGVLTDDNRKAIAAEMRQSLSDLVRHANAQDSSGEYLFAGYQSGTEPYTVMPGGVYVYNGDSGQRYAQISPSNQVATGDPGLEVFGSIPTGNGTFVTAVGTTNTGTGAINQGRVRGGFTPDQYTMTFVQALPTDPITYNVTNSGGTVVASGNYTAASPITFQGAEVTITGTPANGDTFSVSPSTHQDVFTIINNFATALEKPVTDDAERNALAKSAATTLTDLDRGMGIVTTIQLKVGTRLNAIESQKDVNDTFKVQTQETLSSVQDLDYAEAVSRLNRQSLALQAAQESYAKIQGLSLFNFLR